MISRSTLSVRGAVIAVAAVAAAVGLTLLARFWFTLNPTPLILLFLFAAAWFGGRWPGIIYCVLADLAIDLLFEEPKFEFTVNPSIHAVRLMVMCSLSLAISSLRNSKDRLVFRAKQQAAVAEFGQAALAGTELQQLLSNAVETITRVLDVKFAAICKIDNENDKMVFAAVKGWQRDLKGEQFCFSEDLSLSGLVASSAEPVTIQDLRKVPEYRTSQFISSEGIRSMVGVRIGTGVGPYGVLGAFHNEIRSFSEDDVNFLKAIGNVVAEAVERIRSEEEIKEQRTWLQTTLKSIGDGVIATDADGKVIFLNSVAQSLVGWNEADARGRELKEVFRIIDESSRSPIADPVAKVFETGKIVGLSNHTLLVAKDGREIPIDDSAAPITDGTEIKGVVLVFSDVTERKESQRLVLKRAAEIAALYNFTDRLQKSGSIHEVYEAALESIMGAVKPDRASVLLYDESGVMQFVSSRGLSEHYRAKAAGHSPWKQGEEAAEPIGIDDVRSAQLDDDLKEAIIGEGILALGFIPLISNGKLIGKMMIYYDDPHEFSKSEFELAMTVANQVAPGVERKRAEAKLLENEERLRLATQAGKVGVWDWDIRQDRLEWTDALYDIHGLEKGTFQGTLDAYTGLIHPDDRPVAVEALEGSLTSGRPYEAEFRTVRPDGEVRWLFTNARVIADEEGPCRLVGATSDITERVRAEAARRENEIMQRLVEAQEAERHRIARDLHDHLGQKMTGLRFKIESALSKSNDIPALQELLDEIQESALQIDHDIGFLSWELRPTELDVLGLDDALASFVREWSGQYAIKAQFHSNLSEISAQHGRLSRKIETNLYRIAQEGLNNIMKHADAENVSVLLQYRRDNLVLIIEDDGKGLSDGYELEEGKSNGSFGLIGMRERAALLKGTFEIESIPGKGTTLITTVPLYKVFATASA